MLIPFTAKWNANNACIAFCEGNGSIDFWAIIKNEAALSGIKILATVTKNWLIGAWVLAYLNTNNSGFRRIPWAARHGFQALTLLLIYLRLSWASQSISQLVLTEQELSGFLRYITESWEKTIRMRKEREGKKEGKRKTVKFYKYFLKWQILFVFHSENDVMCVATPQAKTPAHAFKHIPTRGAISDSKRNVLSFGLF